MDSEYLKSTVGPALTAAMSALVVEQPGDSVEYLGTYLLSYVKSKEMEASKQEAEKRMAVLLEEANAANAAAEAEAATAAAAQSEKDKEEEVLANELATSTDTASLYGKVLELIKARTNSAAVYLGRKETTDAGVSQIQYLASTQEDMVGKVLKGVAEGEEEGMEGVTWPIFTSSEVEETVVDPETGEESTVTKTVYPEEIVVPNVCREPAIKCFGLPKLGSYVAVPVRYSSCLHENGIEDAPPPPEPVAAEDVDPEAATEATEPVVEEAPPKFSPVLVSSEYIIGFDSVGLGREFTSEEKAFAKKWATKLAEASAEAELKLWNADIATMEATASGEADVVAAIAAAKEAADTAAAAKLGELGEDVSEDEKAYKEVEGKTAAAVEVLAAVKDSLFSLALSSVCPKSETVKALTGLVMIAGYEKATFTDVLTNKVEWSMLKKLINEELIEKIGSIDVTLWTGEGALDGVKGVIEGLEEAGTPFSHIVPTVAVTGAGIAVINAVAAKVEAHTVFETKKEEARVAAEEAAAAAAEGGD
mmetsp:Transcript_10662/g.21935  ORF Transcript_10662/g.21935 Transcript_10662/m.21935 type:complete len:535 (+) Transcript_10662:15-1619(+)